jgi:hypothetical protein
MLQQSAKGFHEIWKSLGGSKKHIAQPKELSDHYLNVQFGWMPFLKDIEDFTRVISLSNEYIADLTRRNNQWEKRFRVLSETESSDRISFSTSSAGCQPAGVNITNLCRPMTINGTSNVKYYHEVRSDILVRIWSSGYFKFYRPEFDSSLGSNLSRWNHVQQMLTLYGARINPSVLYKITPWSWLVDWFSNVGKVVDNVSAQLVDGVVSKDLYLMHRKEEHHKQISVYNFYSGSLTLNWERVFLSKQRSRASNPYGFGLTSSSLSARQWSILAALGLSKFAG